MQTSLDQLEIQQIHRVLQFAKSNLLDPQFNISLKAKLPKIYIKKSFSSILLKNFSFLLKQLVVE